MRDLAEFEVWASQQTEVDVSAPPFDRKIEVHPVIYQVGLGIIYGGMRVERDYTKIYNSGCWCIRSRGRVNEKEYFINTTADTADDWRGSIGHECDRNGSRRPSCH